MLTQLLSSLGVLSYPINHFRLNLRIRIMEPHEFKRKEVRDLFRDKKVVFLGDSIIRKGFKRKYGNT